MQNAQPEPASYAEAVIEHVLVGRARARMLEDIRGNQPWSASLDRGKLQLGRATFGTAIFGTYSHSEGTFLWAWANPGATGWQRSLLQVTMARDAFGDRPGYEMFKRPFNPASEINPNELAYVSAALMGTAPVFVGAHDDGVAFLIVYPLKLHVEQTFPLAYIPGVLLELPTITTAPQRACTRRFLERLGFAIHDVGAMITATRADGRVTATFDELGRLSSTTVDT